jgi:hypothetical protein
MAHAMTFDWYVVCQFARPHPDEQGSRLRPSSTAHAKSFGGTMTACGERASTMQKLYDVSFPVATDNCPACVDVVVEERRRQTQRRVSRTS